MIHDCRDDANGLYSQPTLPFYLPPSTDLLSPSTLSYSWYFPRTSCNRSVYWPFKRKQVHWPTSTLGGLLPSTAPSPSSWPIALTYLFRSPSSGASIHCWLAKSTGRALLLRHSLLLCPSSIRGSRKYRWFARRIKDVTKFHRATVSVRSPAKHKQCFW